MCSPSRLCKRIWLRWTHDPVACRRNISICIQNIQVRAHWDPVAALAADVWVDSSAIWRDLRWNVPRGCALRSCGSFDRLPVSCVGEVRIYFSVFYCEICQPSLPLIYAFWQWNLISWNCKQYVRPSIMGKSQNLSSFTMSIRRKKYEKLFHTRKIK